MIKWIVLLMALLVLTSCADAVTFEQASTIEPVGFWFGLWNGMTFPIAWVGSLFSENIAIYAIYNNGGWYDFGFFLGAGGLSASALMGD